MTTLNSPAASGLTKQNLNARSVELGRIYSPSKAGKEIHNHLLDLLAFNIHPDRNGDVSTLTKFIKEMNHNGKAIVRIDAISTWIARYCPAEWSKSDGVFKGKPKVAAKMFSDDNGKAHIKQAASEPWFAMVKSDPTPKGFDLDKAIAALVKRAGEAKENADGSFDPSKVKIDAEKLTLLETLMA